MTGRVRRALRDLGGVAGVASVIGSALVWGDDGKLAQVRIGPIPVWDRRRWEARPFVRRWRARREGRRKGDT